MLLLSEVSTWGWKVGAQGGGGGEPLNRGGFGFPLVAGVLGGGGGGGGGGGKLCIRADSGSHCLLQICGPCDGNWLAHAAGRAAPSSPLSG